MIKSWGLSRHRCTFRWGIPLAVVATFFFSHKLVLAADEGALPPKPIIQQPGTLPADDADLDTMHVPVILWVDVKGNVTRVQIEGDWEDDIKQAAEVAAKQFRYEPARLKGKMVAAKIRDIVHLIPPPKSKTSKPATHPHSHAPHHHAPGTPTNHQHSHTHTHQHQHQPAPASGVTVQGERALQSASSSVKKRAVLQAAPHRTGSDLLSVFPDIFLTQHSGEGKAHQIFLRGFDAVHGQDIEIWVGGAPVNEVSNVHGQGYADLHFIIPEAVKEIRSMPGTYDVAQGDFAVAGSLRFKLGYNKPGLSAKFGVGSYGMRRYFVGYRPKQATDETFVVFEHYSTDGFGPARSAQRASGMGQMLIPLGEKVRARLMASTYSGRFSSAGVVVLDDVESGKIDRFTSYDPNQGGFSSRTQLVTALEGSGKDDSWSLAPYMVFRSLRLRSNFTGYLLDSTNGDSTQQLNDSITFGARAHYRLRTPVFTPSDHVEAGLVLRADRIEQSQDRIAALDGKVSKRLVNAKVQANQIGGYLEGSFRPIRRVRVTAGLRLDGLSYDVSNLIVDEANKSSQGAHLGKKGNIDWNIGSGVHALLSYGEGFRSPQARSLGNGERTPFTRVTSTEVGVRYAKGKNLSAHLALFRTLLSDDLVFDQETARNERVPATQRLGATVSYQAMIDKVWVASTGVTYTRASFRESGGAYIKNQLVPYVPQLVSRSDLAYTPRLGDLWHRELRGRLGMGLSVLGIRPLPYEEMGRGILTVDARAGVRWQEFELMLDAYNLFDAHYFDGQFVYPSRFKQSTSANLVPQDHVTIGPPRTLFLTLAAYI
jgi:iron complex outermembrane recepter protein